MPKDANPAGLKDADTAAKISGPTRRNFAFTFR
jgi:hypothetical protein